MPIVEAAVAFVGAESGELGRRVAEAMTIATRQALAEGIPLDSPEMLARKIAARDAILAGVPLTHGTTSY